MLCLGADSFWQNLCFKYQTIILSLRCVCKSELSWSYLHNSVTASTTAHNKLNLLATARRTRALSYSCCIVKNFKEIPPLFHCTLGYPEVLVAHLVLVIPFKGKRGRRVSLQDALLCPKEKRNRLLSVQLSPTHRKTWCSWKPWKPWRSLEGN